MIDWIKGLFGGLDSPPRPIHVDGALLIKLREEMQRCESTYRVGAEVCLYVCPRLIAEDEQQFKLRMNELHRGALVKVFVEVAAADREWHAAERELAFELFRHVWGVDVDYDQLVQTLVNVKAHAESLTWKSVLAPFVEMPPLRDRALELGTTLLRVAHLIAKADGKVRKSEVAQLRKIQADLKQALRPGKKQMPNDAKKLAQDVEVVSRVVASQDSGKKSKAKSKASSSSESEETKRLTPEEMLTDAMSELDRLVGLQQVKDDIHQLVNFIKVQEKRRSVELKETSVGLHTVFCGNPGTGKTTVARILARIFGGLKIISKGHTVETDRSGLVAKYAGQTGPRVNERVDEAIGGVLFIDEAYSLVADRGNDPYGHEAVQVLLKRMEDNRDKLVVVLAGYPEPMQRMLRSNPGLSSRFQRTFTFADYSPKELLQIFESMCEQNHYTLAAAARTVLQNGFEKRIDSRDEHFGNGRMVRNLFEKAIRELANRIVDVAPITRELLMQLEPEDIRFADFDRSHSDRSIFIP